MAKPLFKNKISDTLFFTLMAKADESKQKKPIIFDKLACEIVDGLSKENNLDKSLVLKSKKFNRVGVTIRTRFFDNLTSEFIQKNDFPVIVTLGCGLDFRYHRIDSELSRKGIFYYVDLSDVMTFRADLVKRRNNEYYISGNILDKQWIDEISINTGIPHRILFIIEGVLIYFTKDEIETVLNTIVDNFSDSVISFDILNQWLSNKLKYPFGISNDDCFQKTNSKLKYKSTVLITDYIEYKKMGLIKSLMLTYSYKYRNAIKMLTYEVER